MSEIVEQIRMVCRNHELEAECRTLRNAGVTLLERAEQAEDRVLALTEVLAGFAEVADWAERNGHDLRKFDMLLRNMHGQIVGHLQVQADDFISARTALTSSDLGASIRRGIEREAIEGCAKVAETVADQELDKFHLSDGANPALAARAAARDIAAAIRALLPPEDGRE